MDEEIEAVPLCVLGAGALAAAVRVRLRERAPHVEHDQSLSFEPALFLACSDFENASLWPMLAERALADRARVLFACLTPFGVRVGPFVASATRSTCCPRYLTRSWDFGLSDTRETFPPTCPTLTRIADRRRSWVAQIGATLIVGELAKILCDEVRLWAVAENESPPEEGAHSVADGALTHNKTIVACEAAEVSRWVVGRGGYRGGYRSVALAARVWHPVGVE